MSNFRERFEERLPSLEAAIKDMPGSIDDLVPGLSKDRLLRIFQRISILFGRLDSKGSRHPQYLWMNGVLAPEFIIGQIDPIISNSAAGASSFIQNHLHSILDAYDRVERSIGTDASEVKRLLSSVNSDLAIAVAQTDELSSEAQENLERLQESQAAARAAQEAIGQLLETARNDAAKADSARRTIETLTNPDGRNKSSLESLARRARERIAEIENICETAVKELDSAKEKSALAEEQKETAEGVILELQERNKEAQQILNLSSQAGLAASYQKESRNLQNKYYAYSIILYLSAIIAFVVAIYYVIPSLGSALSASEKNGQHIDFWKAFSFTILRGSVLAPLIYVIYFTQKTIGSIELLRMDYAEKAAASLAYSGYKEQMEVDSDLLKQLKASLLAKFAEHPERLLKLYGNRSRAKIRTAGVEVEAEASSVDPAVQ